MASTSGVTRPHNGGKDEILGHPKGLFILFLTEMWERFSYYGMRALLIFYLTQHFLFSDHRSAVIYGAYTALVYVTPVIGGLLADRFLGARKAVTFGALLLVTGHFGMAFEGQKANEFITYQDQSYQIVTDGSGDTSNRYIELDGVRSNIKLVQGGFEIENGAQLGLPNFINMKDATQSVERNQFFLNIFYLSLAFIIAGVGFLKANISTIVGALYAPEDKRRDSGFTIFYMGINLGAFFATLACGYLGQTVGWWAGFGLAGVGMLFGLIIFLRGQHWLEGRAEPPKPEILKDKIFVGINREAMIYLGGLLMVFVSWLLIMNEGVVGDLLNFFGLAVLAFVLGFSLFTLRPKGSIQPGVAEYGLFGLSFLALFFTVFALTADKYVWSFFSFPEIAANATMYAGLIGISLIIAYNVLKVPGTDRDRMLVATFLLLCQIPFWALFEQAGSSLNLLTDRAVDRSLLGFEIPASMFQSLNSLFIFTLAPLFSILWITLARRGWEPSTPVKFALGVFQVGLGFLVLVFGLQMGADDARMSMIWIVMIYFLHTTGELCLSPVGLSMITKLSVKRVVGMMMGVWFLASGFANYVAGTIAATTGAETIGGEITDLAAAKTNYATVYTNIGWIAVGIALVIFLVSPILRRGMHDGKASDTGHNMAGEPQLAEAGAAGVPISSKRADLETRD